MVCISGITGTGACVARPQPPPSPSPSSAWPVIPIVVTAVASVAITLLCVFLVQLRNNQIRESNQLTQGGRGDSNGGGALIPPSSDGHYET